MLRKVICFWSEERAFALPSCLEVESNLDHQRPAGPGSFHFQGDTKRQIPHSSPPSFESKARYRGWSGASPPMHRLAWCRLFRFRTANSPLCSMLSATNAGLNKTACKGVPGCLENVLAPDWTIGSRHPISSVGGSSWTTQHCSTQRHIRHPWSTLSGERSAICVYR